MAPVIRFFCLIAMDLLVIELALLGWLPGHSVFGI